jgi:hypothetical protein
MNPALGWFFLEASNFPGLAGLVKNAKMPLTGF